MTEQFFSVNYAGREDLFQGLSIWEDEKYRRLQGTYPVISLSFANVNVWLNALMTLRNEEPVKNILDEFGIPSRHIVWCMAALGYPLEEGTLLAKKKDVVVFI